jgi:hypothetical protein
MYKFLLPVILSVTFTFSADELRVVQPQVNALGSITIANGDLSKSDDTLSIAAFAGDMEVADNDFYVDLDSLAYLGMLKNACFHYRISYAEKSVISLFFPIRGPPISL